MNLCLVEESEKLWLYRVEDAILTVEVKPIAPVAASDRAAQAIGQVVLKRLISADQVLERLGSADAMCTAAIIPSVLQ